MQNRNTKTGPARGRLAVALAACAAFVSAPLFAASDLPGWDAELVKVVSSLDHTEQPCWFWAPETAKTNDVPLVVGLHTWSGDYKYKSHYAMVLDCAHKRGWAFLGPDFRGPNKTPKACGSDYAVQDIVDAVAYARRRVKVDASRIYIIGASGGGHMTLLMRARHPEIFAAAVAFCPVTDLARWHADSLADGPCRNKTYAEMLEASCGGTPADCKKEYLRRSPVAWLARPKSRQAKVPTYICTGIHDGWRGSVPVGHAIRARLQGERPVLLGQTENLHAAYERRCAPDALRGRTRRQLRRGVRLPVAPAQGARAGLDTPRQRGGLC